MTAPTITVPDTPAAVPPAGTRPLATITGTMLTPGVSRNRRLYTPEAIGRAVTRMRERLADPAGLPLVMRTHHDAGDDSRRIVGKIVDVSQLPDGTAAYRAHLFNTEAGRDIGALINPAGPALKSTSIYGYWIGPVEQRRHGTETVETAADLEVDAIDFTASPGVPGAQVKTVAYESVASRKENPGQRIEEAGQATITPDLGPQFEPLELDEVADQPNPIFEKYNTAQRKAMAAKGQARDDGSYPVATKGDLRKAIRAVGRGGADHDKIRQHIIARAKALGLSGMIPDNWGTDGSTEETSPPTAPAEATTPAAPAVAEGVDVEVCVYDDDGPIVRVCATNVDPDDVRKVAKQAAKVAARALDARDNPDGDDEPTPGPAEPEPYQLDDMTPDETRRTPEEPAVADTWTITVNGEPMEAAQARTIVAAALTEQHPAPPTTPTEPAVEPAAQPTAPAVATQEGVAVGDTAKVADQATPTTTSTATVEQTAAGPDLVKLVAEATAAAVTAAFKAERKRAKAAKATTETTTTEPAPAVAETDTKATSTPATETTTETAPAVVTVEELEQRLNEDRQKTAEALRQQLLKEYGLPPRRGHRYVTESEKAGQPADPEELWNTRGQVWDQFFPAGNPLAAPALAAAQAQAAQGADS